MRMMIRRSSVGICFPSSNTSSITELDLSKDRGNVIFCNGIAGEIWPQHGHLLNLHAFDRIVRITSRSAGYDWMQKEDQVWETLSGVTLANFFGEYEDALICKLVEKCSNASIMSFTYFRAPVFENILGSITSPRLIELTAHVNGTSSSPEQVFPALSDLGNRTECKLMRLCLFFSTGYDGTDVGEAADQAFGNVIQKNSTNPASVVLLFGYEMTNCMLCLQNVYKYKAVGKMTSVQNGPPQHAFADVETSDNVVLENYYLFQKVINGTIFVIGCKKRSTPPTVTFGSDSVVSNLDIIDEQREFKLLDITSQLHIPPEQIPYDVLGNLATNLNRRYSNVTYALEFGTTVCCNPATYHRSELGDNEFSAPIWDTTRVTRLVYLEKDTRFVMSNGLIFQLRTMSMEADFLMYIKALARVTLICTTQSRRWIQVRGLSEFLFDVKHAEFCGKWFATPLQNILERLPYEKCNTISLMRLKLDRKVSVIMLNSLDQLSNAGLTRSITKYFYDCRDTVEESLASVVNGIIRHAEIFKELESLVIIARTLNENNYYTGWQRVIEDLYARVSLRKGAVVTIIVHEYVPVSEMNLMQFAYQGDVLVPGIYSSRQVEADWTGLMQEFRVVYKEIEFFFVIPHSNLSGLIGSRQCRGFYRSCDFHKY